MDATLVERARAGNREALEQLLEELAPLVRRFGMRMCRHDADAEDVLQDTLLTVATHLDDFEARASISSWVFALARSACARKRRGLKNRPHESMESMGERRTLDPSPEAEVGAAELRAALDRALLSLPHEYREVLLLRDMEGLTAPEVADALGESVSAVKSRLHRARAALRTALRDVLERGAPRPEPSCPDVLQELSKKLEGDLDAADCATMEAHVATCAACASTCDALRTALGACRARASEPVPEAVQQQIKEAIRDLRTLF